MVTSLHLGHYYIKFNFLHTLLLIFSQTPKNSFQHLVNDTTAQGQECTYCQSMGDVVKQLVYGIEKNIAITIFLLQLVVESLSWKVGRFQSIDVMSFDFLKQFVLLMTR